MSEKNYSLKMYVTRKVITDPFHLNHETVESINDLLVKYRGTIVGDISKDGLSSIQTASFYDKDSADNFLEEAKEVLENLKKDYEASEKKINVVKNYS